LIKSLICILIITITTACTEQNNTDKQQTVPTKDKTIDDVLVKINGKSLSKSQFNSYLKFKRLPLSDDNQHKRILDQYIEREALADSIINEKLLDLNLIQAELNEFRKELLISRYFEKFLMEKVTDDAVLNYYNTHANKYEQKKAHAAHILIRTHNKMGEIERRAKLTLAQEAYSKLRIGKPFEDIAKQYSEDSISAKKGGDLGWIKQGSIDPLFSTKLFALSKGSITEPFETSFGFHIVKLLEAPKIIKQPFKSVASDIKYQLRNMAKNAELKRLKALSTIE